MWMGKTKRFARAMGFTLAVTLTGPAAAQEEAAGESSDTQQPAGKRKARPAENTAQRAERLEKRRQRLLKGAERLRERAAELRRKAAAGETPKAPPNSKRPPRSFEEQAKRFEEQAAKMESRAQNLEREDEARVNRRERSPAAIRERRHRIRRAQLNRRWGQTLRKPEAAAELRTHAERVAKLKRIRQLAQKKSKDDPIAQRATELLAKEEARHEQRMKELHGNSKTPGEVRPARAEEETK